MTNAVVTGGSGFIGAYLSRQLLSSGWNVTVIDNNLRGVPHRLKDIKNDIEIIDCDVRDTENLTKHLNNKEVVFHLAAINGTENFYNQPELVLDVGVRGAISVSRACQIANVPDLVVASSAEVYQTPHSIPTDENVPLMLPDTLNPRYSYGGSKIISELIAFNYGRDHFRKVQVFRPHNIYGPDMGYKHVIPQFIIRALDLHKKNETAFLIQGSGQEKRAFCYVDDVVDGIITMYEKGDSRNIYHIGNDKITTIQSLATEIAGQLGHPIEIVTSEAPIGETPIRCPSIQKMCQLGYRPKIGLEEGLSRSIEWYRNNFSLKEQNELL